MLFKNLLLFVFFLLSSASFSQRYTDLGIRLNSANYNRVQLELRKPVGQFYFCRFGLSVGFQYEYPRNDIFAANDSVVTSRQEDIYGNHYDFRFGFERMVSYDWLTFHADLIGGYSSITNRRSSYFHLLDSTGTSWDYTSQNPYNSNIDETATAVNAIVSGGIALGLSFNFPVTENFILNFTGNYTGMMRYAVGQKERNDLYNEFEYKKYSAFEVYPSAGIGLRFVFVNNNDKD